jgi:hypothetical protein
MSPVIRISRANWERLKQFAIPLEDSIDDALSKALTLAEGSEAQQNFHPASINEHVLKETVNPAYSMQETIKNEKPLLLEFERWLQQVKTSNAVMLYRKKTMATWQLRTTSGKTFKLFVPTDGGNTLCLPKGNYTSLDTSGKVIQKDCVNDRTGKSIGWYHYGLLRIKKPDDLILAKDLVKFIIDKF